MDSSDRDLDEYGAVIEFAKEHSDFVSAAEFDRLKELFQERVRDYDCGYDFEELDADANKIESIARMCGLDLEYDVAELRERAARLEEEAESRSDDDYDRWRDESFMKGEDERDIDSMFDVLR